MASDPENVRDEEIETTEQAEAALSGTGDTGAMMDVADSGALDQSDVPAPSGASDTGVGWTPPTRAPSTRATCPPPAAPATPAS